MNLFYSVCLVLVILSMLGLLYRVWKGPSVPDRLVALDAIGVMLISAIALAFHLIRYTVLHRCDSIDRHYVVYRHSVLLQIH